MDLLPDLLPDLPNDLARECLIRVSYKQFAVFPLISKAWRAEIRLPEFTRRRKASSHTQKLLVMAQAKVDPGPKPDDMKRYAPIYRVTVLDVSSGDWCELPPIPKFPNGLPMFCQLASVGLDLVVMGGLDPFTWEVSSAVHVFNFASGKWRNGADMPGVRRSFFGCGSDHNRMVYIAGGHDVNKNALKTVMGYDVADDDWVILPEMERERDECTAVFRGGKLHVIGGYCTETQGQFGKSAESLEVSCSPLRWGPVMDDFLRNATCPRTCVGDDDGDEDLYTCCGDDVYRMKNDTWQNVAKLPDDVCRISYLAKWRGNLVVIGCRISGEDHMVYMLDLLNKYKWTKLETNETFSGHVQSGCYFEI